MRTLLCSAALFALIGTSLIAEEKEGKPDIAEKPSAPALEKSDFKKDFLARQAELFDLVEKANPKMLEQLSNADMNRMLKDFAASLGAGLELLPAPPEAASAPKSGEKKEPFSGITIFQNKILYLRLDDFSPETFNRLKEDCEAVSRLANRPLGIIFDLRACNGSGSYQEAIDALSLFLPVTDTEALPKKTELKRAFDLPSAILISDKTSGASELFASLMAGSRKAVTIGGKSAGHAFSKKSFTLKDGTCLLVPDIPEALRGLKLPLAPIAPSIQISKTTQLPYDEFKALAEMDEIPDKCLVRGIDVLISVDALNLKASK